MSCRATKKCTLTQLPNKLVSLVKQRVSQEQGILACYLCEMKDEGLIWGID